MILYELGGPPARGVAPRHYSVFSWRTRLALAHKGLAFESRAVKVTDKASIAFSKQRKVPIIQDGDTIVCDSFKIAQYLEEAYPDRPTLFGGQTGQALARFFNSWADRQLIGTLFPSLMLDNERRIEADDAAYIRAQFERAAGKTLEALAQERGSMIDAFRRLLDPVRSVLRAHSCLGGEEPRYPDHILFSVLQWCRISTPEPVLAPDDLVLGWFERMLDAYGGMGRSEPAADAEGDARR